MKHKYKITGMTCGGCESKVKSSLLIIPGITQAEVSKENQSATVTMEKHIPLTVLQKALDKKYSISAEEHNEVAEHAKSWFDTYKPVVIIFLYITIMAVLIAFKHEAFDWMFAMNSFMAGFFLIFSFFKMLDLKGFAESYSMYDIVAKRITAWGFIYPFIELGLGLAYATGFQPLTTNIITFVVMSISLIGVLQSIFNKRKIQCACLGAVFKLPMSTVTIIEDALMIIMSAGMIAALNY